MVLLIVTLEWAANCAWCQQSHSDSIPFADHYAGIAPLTSQQVADGWIALFDGHSFFGWRSPDTGTSTVGEGAMHPDQGRDGLLRTASQFDHYELLVEFVPDAELAGGLWLRTSPRPGHDDGYEIKLLGSGIESGSLTGHQTSGGCELLPGSGNQLRVRLQGSRIQVWINQKLVNDYQIPLPFRRRGYIGLQCERGALQVNSILLKPLSAAGDLPVQDTRSWNPSSLNGFAVRQDDSGEIVLTGGPGFLESDQSFGNFVLQLESRISSRGNSGVFFRCIPGENMNGYESQIDNQAASDSPVRPANTGTGGIFRRKDARRLIAGNEAWFSKTIVVEGPHMAVWINGYQVTDWTDKRKPNANPRRGLRTEPGTLMFQGHDEQTEVRFRNVRIRELEPR